MRARAQGEGNGGMMEGWRIDHGFTDDHGWLSILIVIVILIVIEKMAEERWN